MLTAVLATAFISVPDTLESVAVTGSRIPLALGQNARIVTVMDSYTISSTPATSISDLLKNAVGVDVRQRGAMGMQTDISVRGGTFDQIALLLDGVNISDPQTGHNAADFPVELSQIERIEIVEGPAARCYGTSSLQGAINIVTKSSSDGLSLRAEGGSYGLWGIGASTGVSTGRVSHKLSASFDSCDGFSKSASGTPNTDFISRKAFYRGDYAAKGLKLSWHAGASMRDYGSSTFYSAKFDNQFEHTLKTFASLRSEIAAGKMTVLPSAYWNRSYDRFELIRGNSDAVPFNHHRTDVFGLNLGLRTKSLAFGADMRSEGIVSTNLGEPLEKELGVYKTGLTRFDMVAYAEYSRVRPVYSYSLGLVAHKNTGNSEQVHIYPGADFSLRLGDSWKIYASFNESWRMPTFTELYYSVGGHKADSHLKAEKMAAVEGGVKYLRPGIRAIATLWYHNGRDMIDWVRSTDVPDDVWRSVNHANVNSLGEELTLRLEPYLLFSRPAFPLRSVEVNYAHISQNKQSEEGIESYYALEYLRNKVVVRADMLFFGKLGLDLSWRWQDRASSAEAGAFTPYSLLDAKFSFTQPRWKAYVSAENILGTVWFDHKYVPQPGRWFKFGVEISLFQGRFPRN